MYYFSRIAASDVDRRIAPHTVSSEDRTARALRRRMAEWLAACCGGCYCRNTGHDTISGKWPRSVRPKEAFRARQVCLHSVCSGRPRLRQGREERAALADRARVDGDEQLDGAGTPSTTLNASALWNGIVSMINEVLKAGASALEPTSSSSPNIHFIIATISRTAARNA